MSVREMLSKIPASELTEWMAFYQIAPFGETRADARSAIVASVVANTARDVKKRRKPYKPSEFMPKFRRKNKDAQDLLGLATLINAALGGKDLRAETETEDETNRNLG